MVYKKSYKTKKGRAWIIKDGDRTVCNLGVITEKEAERIRNAIEQEVERQRLAGFGIKKEINFVEYLDEYRERYLIRKAPKTIKSEERAFAVFVQYFQNARLSQIQKTRIEDYRTWREKQGYAVHTVHQEMRILRIVLNCATEDGYLIASPFARKIKFPQLAKRIPRFLTQEEAERLLDNCDGHIRSIVLLALMTGLRIGEILSLRFKDIDFQAGALKKYATKTKAERLIELNKNALAELEWLRNNWIDPYQRRTSLRTEKQKGYVFCHQDGSPIKSIKKSFGTAKRLSGLRDIKFHDLRRSFATWIMEAGFHPRIAQQLAGHADTKTTLDIYTGIDRKQMRSAVDSLPEFKTTHASKLRIIKGQGEQ